MIVGAVESPPSARTTVGKSENTMQRHKSRDIIRFFNLRSSKIKNIYMKPANGRQYFQRFAEGVFPAQTGQPHFFAPVRG